jgi:hypothetical protein
LNGEKSSMSYSLGTMMIPPGCCPVVLFTSIHLLAMYLIVDGLMISFGLVISKKFLTYP